MEENNLDFSIIVCCYNPDFNELKKTINSILNQKNVNYEIVIADDGSKNNYKDDLSKYLKLINSEDKFKYSYLKENVGTVKNIINALELCEGNYIKLLSPADYLYNELSLCEYLNAFKEGNYDLVFGDAVYYHENELLNSDVYSYNEKVFKTKNLKKYYCKYGGYFLGATIAMKKNVQIDMLKRIENKIIYIEDNPVVTMLLMEDYKLYGINKPLIWYEFGTGISTSKNISKRFLDDFDKVNKFLYEYYPNNKLIKRIYNFHKVAKKSFIKKLIIYLLKFPSNLLFKLKLKFFKHKKFNINIENKNLITNIQ